MIDDGGRNFCVSRSEPLEKASSKRLLINRLVLFLCCVQLSECLLVGGLSQLCRLVTGKKGSDRSSVESRTCLTAAGVCKESERVIKDVI